MHIWLLGSALIAATVPAQSPANDAATAAAGDEIVVVGRRESTLDLARLARAQATFARYRAAYAPGATLYFELRPSHGVALDGFRLMLRGGGTTVAIPIDANHRFTLPPLPKGPWELVHNRGARQIALRAIVLSPGMSEADRPLGDLRLQCRVGRALNGDEMSLRERMIFDVVGACTSKRVALHFRSPRPLAQVAVTAGGISRTMAIDWNGRRYVVPANDRTLANDARVRLTYR